MSQPNKDTMDLKELQLKQSWSLEQKVSHTLDVISTYIKRRGGIDKVYLSYSGGKDSDVLLYLCRMLYPNITAVFINTGNEFPEIIKHVTEVEKSGVNLVKLRPERTLSQVFSTFGFPLVSKEVAQKIDTIRKNPDCPTSLKFLSATNRFALSNRWRYLIDEPYNTSAKCCEVLKKRPAHKYQKETGRTPILGILASESKLRETTYLKMGGCNSFSGRNSVSWPLAIWTEQDIWDFIKRENINVCEIYKKGVTRTGCVCCGFGAYLSHHKNPSLLQLYKLHPKYYEMIMNYTNGETTYREALRKLKAVTGYKLPEDYPIYNRKLKNKSKSI